MTQQNKIGKDGLLAFYHGQLRQLLQGKAGPFLYRGHESTEWELQSGATQRIRESSDTPDEHPVDLEDFIEYHKTLIDTVRRKRWSSGNDNQIPSDLEILATLQHNGAATCLLDFTSRFDTALWFACRGKQDEDGAVFVFGINEFNPAPYKITAQETEKTIEELLKFQTRKEEKPGTEPQFWHWDPEILMGRMLSQSSQFLFGPQDIPESGYCESIVIKKDHKKELLEELEKQQGLRPETVFADIHGFADANARNVPLDPAAVSFFRGNVKFKQGDYDGAIADYNESIRLGPGVATPWNNRGNTKKAKGDIDGAIADFDEAVRLRPDLVAVWINRGGAKSEKGDFDGAIADYDEVIRLQPNYAPAWNNRGGAKSKNGDHNGAIADCNKAIRLRPNYAEAWNNRGSAKGRKGDLDGAIADFDEAIRLRSDDAHTWYNRGSAKGQKGDYDDAITDFDEALRLQPGYEDAIHNRKLALEARQKAIKKNTPPPTS